MNEPGPDPGDQAANGTGLSAGRLAEVACLLEVTARKPGNVHRFRDFADLHYLDFLLSATAIGGPLDRAVERGIGATVLAAVKATRRVVSTKHTRQQGRVEPDAIVLEREHDDLPQTPATR